MALAAVRLFPGDSGLLTKVGLVVLCVIATVAAIRLVPRSWRPVGALAPLIAAAAAFVTIRIAAESGFSEWLDHEVFERVGGETDDFPTWLIACAAAACALGIDRARRR